MTDEERPKPQLRGWLQDKIDRVDSMTGGKWASSVESRNAAHDALASLECSVWNMEDAGIDLVGVLIDEIAARDEQHRVVIEERCPSDERHCTCVPILRVEAERLKFAIRLLLARNQSVSIDKITEQDVNDYLAGIPSEEMNRDT